MTMGVEKGVPPSPSRRRPVREKGKRTRDRLLQAAERVFAGKGYLGARVADIAAEAEVAHGTFYTYFTSKENIFRETAVQLVEDMYTAMGSADESGETAERIRAANRRFLQLYEQHAPLIAVIEQVATFSDEFRELRLGLRRRFIDRIEHTIRRLAAEGVEHRLDPHVAANALAGMVDNFAYAWFVLKEPFDRELAVQTLDEVWLRALRLH